MFAYQPDCGVSGFIPSSSKISVAQCQRHTDAQVAPSGSGILHGFTYALLLGKCVSLNGSVKIGLAAVMVMIVKNPNTVD